MSQRQGGYVQRMEVIVKRKNCQWGGGGGQGRCERRSEAFVKIQCFFFFFFFFFLGGGGVGLRGGAGRCELRSEAFVKIQKKYIFLGGEGVVGLGGGGSGWM